MKVVSFDHNVKGVKLNVDVIGAFYPLLLMGLFSFFLFWLLLRAVRAIERISDNQNTSE